jgi:hypothetical protein
VETVFSGAGKFTEEAHTCSDELLRRVVRLHYNWKYPFLRPSIDTVVKRYLIKFNKKLESKHQPTCADAILEEAIAAAQASASLGSWERHCPVLPPHRKYLI